MDGEELQRLYLQDQMSAKDNRSDDDLGLALGAEQMGTLSLRGKAGSHGGGLGGWLGWAVGDWGLGSPLDALELGKQLVECPLWGRELKCRL